MHVGILLSDRILGSSGSVTFSSLYYIVIFLEESVHLVSEYVRFSLVLCIGSKFFKLSTGLVVLL